MSFYVTLPCTASKAEFPSNTRGKFTTLLSREIHLPGQWEVGLCEIFLPIPKVILIEDSEILYGKNNGQLKSLRINAADCTSFSDLEKLITPVDETGSPYFRFSIQQEKLTLHVADGSTVRFSKGPLGSFLGFSETVTYKGRGKSEETKFIANPKSTLDLVYIYCDLSEYSIVGDSLVPCLRTVPLAGNTKPTVLRFDNVHYTSLQANRFSTVEIVVADDLGKEVEFKDGLTIVKLHLRPKK